MTGPGISTFLLVRRLTSPFPILAFVPQFLLRCLRSVYDNVVLGGTFDRLHKGHFTLLTEALLRCRQRMTIGVTEASMLRSKTLPELILPCQTRIEELTAYLKSCDPSIRYNIVPITDPFGPSIVEPDLNAIIGSDETEKGCHKVNEKRVERGLGQLDVILVRLAKDTQRQSDIEEEKVSSSSQRIRLLGSRLKEPLRPWLRGKEPYIIGLTGGSASGKSSVAKRLEKLGAAIIDCDKLGHRAYEPGTACFNKVVQAFGQDIVGEDGQINRRALGSLVFGNPENKSKLEAIVWPEIMNFVLEEAGILFDQGQDVIVLDAAVLLAANWHSSLCHEVWSCIINKPEAIKRIMERDSKTEAEAEARVNSQLPNSEVVAQSNVVFCTQWEPEFTQKQVEKAWQLLNTKLGMTSRSSKRN